MPDLQAIPILLMAHGARTEAFANRLGCQVKSFGDYLILRGHSFELHFSNTKLPSICLETSCYICRGATLAPHMMLSLQPGLQVSVLTGCPWGMTDFHIIDPDGNLPKLGMSSDEIPADFDIAEHNKELVDGHHNAMG